MPRRIAKGLAFGIAGVMVAALVASFIVHRVWNRERSARSITRWASAAMSGRGGPTQQGFTFGSVEYPWLPALRSLFGGRPVRFTARDVTIFDPDGREVLHAHEVDGGLRLGHLVWTLLRAKLTGRSDVELFFVDAVVDELRCGIARRADGTVNLVAAFASPKPRAPVASRAPSGFIIAVQGATVLDGRYAMRFTGWSGLLEHLHLDLEQLRYSTFAAEQAPGRPAFTYRARKVGAPGGRITIGSHAFPIERFVASRFEAQDPARQDMVMKGTMRSLDANVGFDGRLTETYAADKHGVDLQLEFRHGRGLLERLVKGNSLSGEVALSAHLLGPFSKVVVSGTVRDLQAKAEGLKATEVAAKYRLSGNSLSFQHIDSVVADGHVLGEATLELAASTFSADLTLKGVHESQLGREWPLVALVYLDGIASRVAHEGKGTDDVVEHLTVKGVEATLHRHPRETLPYRIQVRGPM